MLVTGINVNMQHMQEGVEVKRAYFSYSLLKVEPGVSANTDKQTC